MKKLLLFASAVALSINLATAQAPGFYSTYAYDDFQSVNEYSTGTTGGVYWYNAGPGAINNNATRVIGSSTFSITGAAAYLSVNFGNNSTTPIDLSSMADIEVDLRNSSTMDLTLRFFLKDINGAQAVIEPNISDCVGVPDFATPNPTATWTGQNLVYPDLSNGGANPAVYPIVAYNGFVVPAGTRDTYRLDLSSVSTSVGGRLAGAYTGGTPINSPQSTAATSANFDITKVVVAQFQINEGVNWNLSGKGLNTDSYKYDIIGGTSQNNYAGNIIFYSFKLGSILSPLAGIPTGLVNNDAAVDGSLKVYPNPANESLNVSFDSNFGGTVSLSDIVGNTAYTTVANAGQNQIKVNTSSLTKGMYILTVTTENGKASRKISIE